MGDLSPEDSALAAEFALSLLTDAAHDTARARLGTDPDFAAAVARWQDDLAGLAADLPPEQPAPAVRSALMARLPEPAPPRRWVLGAGLAGLAAAAAAALVYVILPPEEVLVAELAPEGRDYRVIASLPVGRDTLRLARTDGAAAPPGRSTEIWAIAPDAAPVSLGLVPDTASWRVTLPAQLIAQAAALTIALSDEPDGGAPGAAPSGAILATGQLTLR